MDYFSPAVQLGLTATPKREENADTYRYFGEPEYIYSLKQGIEDGFLTPFKVRRITTDIDTYVYDPDDTIIEGQIDPEKIYEEKDFNKIIEMKIREKKRVEILLNEINQNEKTIVFCANQSHAAAIRDLINQLKANPNPDYCVRVTANDGAIGDTFLKQFQDNERTIPTILTTSQKLSTGVDALNIRNIVLFRPINSMIEFKQIIGRGTRTFDGKNYFTIYDFTGASHHFADPDWDGEPLEPEPCERCGHYPCICKKAYPDPDEDHGDSGEVDEPEPCDICGNYPCTCNKKQKIIVRLADGKEREINHEIATSLIGPDGKPISVEEYMESLYGALPDFFRNEDELRKIWADPLTRKELLERLNDSGFNRDDLLTLQQLINAEKSDLLDVLEYVAYALKPITREYRVNAAKRKIMDRLNNKQKEFIDFVLSKYIEVGVDELDQEKLPKLLELKYNTLRDAVPILGDVDSIKKLFVSFQKQLYGKKIA
jgi:type I restriction enzyme R subunit